MAEKILFIDDDPETLRLVTLILHRQGYQVLTATSGAQGLAMAASELPDIILLDVMMPDMDGYQVARSLRQTPETARTPIMMFTARRMVDDKVAGYESGVDDYITKPVHPKELSARMKALLARGAKVGTGPLTPRARVIGFVAPKGGLGVSTLVLNLALQIYRQSRAQVIAAELRPGHGTWGMELGFANASGLNNLLRLKPAQINLAAVEAELIQTSFGIRLLLAGNHARDTEGINATAQLEAVLQELSLMANYVMVDIGAVIQPGIEKIAAKCQEIFVVTEPYPGSVQRTRLLVDDLRGFGFGKNKILNVVMVNRQRVDMQLTMNQVQEILGQQVLQIIPPAPELSFNAAMRSMPMAALQPEGTFTLQLNGLVDQIIAREAR